MAALQLERRAVIDVVADVFLIGEHLMDGRPRPLAAKVGANASRIEDGGDFSLRPALGHKRLIDPANVGLLVIGTRNEHDPVGLDALLLTMRQHSLRLSGLVHQHPAQSITRNTTLLVTEGDQAAGTLEYF